MKRSNPFFDEELLREASLKIKNTEQPADNQPSEEYWTVDMLECTMLHIGKPSFTKFTHLRRLIILKSASSQNFYIILWRTKS
jgi:hypothetical protein